MYTNNTKPKSKKEIMDPTFSIMLMKLSHKRFFNSYTKIKNKGLMIISSWLIV